MEWDFPVVDEAAFLVEHERYLQMIQQGREDLIDPLWIAVYCMVRVSPPPSFSLYPPR